MKKLILNLTEDQHDRIELVAKLLHAKPEHLVIGLAFGELEGGDWDDSQDWLDHVIEFYGAQRNAYPKAPRKRIEDGAHDRMLRAAGYKFAHRKADREPEATVEGEAAHA